MNPDPADVWRQLAAAHGRQLRAVREPVPAQAPSGFAERLGTRWQDIIRATRLLFARRWAQRAALAAGALFLAALVLHFTRPVPPLGPSPLEAPAITLPVP